MSGFVIRKATFVDVDTIKNLADAHKHELGFVRRPALVRSVRRQEMLVAENSLGIVGFIEYHHRLDCQTTLYHIAVCSDYQRQGVGQRLVDALIRDAAQRNKRFIQVKCPVDLQANEFYERLGFSRVDVQPGRNRDLAVWRLSLGSALRRMDKGSR